MKLLKYTVKIGVAMALLSAGDMVSAQDLQRAAPSFRAKIQGLSPSERKLSSNLYEALQKMKAAGITRENAAQRNVEATFSTPLVKVDANGRFDVTLRTTEITPSLLSQLAGLEFEVVSSTANLSVTSNHQMISGWVPFDRIEDIARLAPIFHLRPTDKPIVLTGSVTSAGDAILRADMARTTFSINGFGQKVGIISDGVDHRADSQASGDLPATLQVINNRFGGDEGTAMLEIVYDLAPGAALAFADNGNSQADFANNINLLRNAGCTVISDDFIYFLEPAYEDGVIAQTVNNVVNNNNIVYTSSAGNQQRDHYEEDFRDNDNDGFHEFSAGDETISTTLAAGATIRLILQWNNAFGKSGDDYDLFLYDNPPVNVLASSTNPQDGNDDPIESLAFTNTGGAAITVNIIVQIFSGSRNRELTIYTYGGGVTPLEYADDDNTIYGHAAAQRCLAVGAIDASDPGNNDIESFSNRGPSRIYSYDASGNPVNFVDRPKPEHAAIDGVQTKTGQLGFFSNPFFGTSAATPHTAGVAALVRQAAPALTAVQVGDVLNNTAVDLGAPGFDIVFGNGRIDAFNAVQSVVGGTLFQGPATGSVSGGAIVNTNNFSFAPQKKSGRPQEAIPLRDIEERLRRDRINPIAPTGPVGSNFIEDRSGTAEQAVAPNLHTNFAGIEDIGARIPPDPHMAAGPNHIMATVNSQFAIYNKTGTRLKLIDAVDWFANVNPDGGPFDPQIVYDHHAARWIMVWIAFTENPPRSSLLLSVSDDSDPIGNWCNWRLPGNQNGSTSNTFLNDYEKIGLDAEAIYVTANMFNILPPKDFQYAQLRIIPKVQLLGASCGPVTWKDFWDLRNPSNLAATVFTTVPAVTFGTPGTEYFVDVDFINNTGTFMNLWSLTNPLSATPGLTAVTVSVTAFTSPPNADQLGGGTPLIDVGGRRNRNVVYQNGSVWTAHSVGDATGQFANARYVKIDVNTKTATEDVSFGATNFWYYYPAVQPDGSGNLVMAFTRSGTNEFAGARFTGRLTSDPPGLQSSAELKAGEDNYVKTFSGTRNRWGDYMGIARDPVNGNNVWMFVEYAETAAGPGPNEDRWGTWFGYVSSGTPPPPCTFCGDVNEDGVVNSTDALIILSFDIGLQIPQTFLDAINRGCGDVNLDNATNSTDALIILTCDAGLPQCPSNVGRQDGCR